MLLSAIDDGQETWEPCGRTQFRLPLNKLRLYSVVMFWRLWFLNSAGKQQESEQSDKRAGNQDVGVQGAVCEEPIT